MIGAMVTQKANDNQVGERRMTVRDVMEILGAECLVGEDRLDNPVASGCGSDLMSDVLAFVKDNAVLITGLINPQVIRTAEMLDICNIVFRRI